MASAASGAAATWLQIRAGLRKNWLLTTRNKKELRVEATQTILLLLGVLFFSSLFSNDQRGDQLAFRPSTVYSLRPAALGGNVIGLAVQNGTCTPQLLSAVRAAASALPVSSVLCFPSPAAMEDRAVERNDVLAGFVLPSADPVEDAIQGRLSVVLRTNHTLLGNAPYGDAFTPAPYVSQLRSSLRGPAPSVFGGTFTALQAMLGEALLQLAADAREATSGERPWPNTTRALNLAVQQFPVPAHSLNLASNALRTLLPIYLTMIFSYQLRSFLQRMLEEKEGKLKELLRMTGLSPVAYWLSWILAAGLKSLFLVVASSVVLLSTVPQADPLLIFIFLAAFSASTIAFACVVAAVFSKAKTGAGVGMLVFLVSYLPTVLAVVLGNPAAGLYSVDGLGGSTSPTGIETTATGHPTGRAIGFLFLSLLSPSAFAMGLVVVNDAEMVGNGGAKWGALNSRFSSVIPLPLGTLLLMLLLDTALYTFLAWYLDQVLPQEFGVRKHPLFCLRRRRGSPPGASLDPLMAAAPPLGHRLGGEAAEAAQGSPTPDRAAASGATDALQSLRSRQPESWDGTFADGPVEALSGEGWTAPLRIQGLTKVFPGAKSDGAAGTGTLAGRGGALAALARLCPRCTRSAGHNHESEMTRLSGVRGDGADGANSGGGDTDDTEGFRARRPSWRFRRSYQPLCTSDGSSLAGGEAGEEGEEGVPALHVGARDLVAVDNLWMSVYEGQITALLGHNGAGKSTTISLLSGLFEASVGDAHVYGRSLVEDTDGVRQLLGVCPQQDTLYDKLTPADHLRLFAELRGVDKGRAQRRAAFYLDHLGLAPKRDALVETLSGGQKRKLCIAAALIGEPRVLLLDEPTSGMDAASRRQVWTLLEACKQDRITLLLTHDMAEAELLGDRVAILSKGRLRVVGSGLFLKSAFDLGYTLTLRTQAPAGVDARAAAADLVHRHVPDATAVVSSAGVSAPLPQWAVDADDSADAPPSVHVAGPSAPEGRGDPSTEHIVAFTLPMQQSSAFPALLRALERAVEAAQSGESAPDGDSGLVVRAYGLSVTSLEEVFLKLAEEEEEAEEERGRAEVLQGPPGAPGKVPRVAEVDARTPVLASSPAESSGLAEGIRAGAAGGLTLAPVRQRPSVKAQTASVLRRRLLTSKRDYRSTWLQVGAPLLMMAVATIFRSFMAIGGQELEPERLAPAPLDWAAAAPPDVAPRPLLAPYTAHPLRAYLARTPTVASAGASRRLVGAGITQTWVQSAFNASGPSSPWPAASLGAPTPVDLTYGVPFGAGGARGPPRTPNEFGAALLAMFRARNATSGAAYKPGTSSPYSATVLYNTTLTRSLPAAVSSLYGALLRSVAGCGEGLGAACSPGPGLTTSVHPFPKLPEEETAGLGTVVTALAAALYVGIGFTLLPSVQAMAVVKERATRARAMQRVAGVRSLAYWLGMLAHDMVLLLPVAVLGTLLLAVGFGSTLYGDFPGTGIAAYLLTFAVGGVAAAPMAYILALLFTNQVTAQTYISLILSILHTLTFSVGAALHFVASSSAATIIINVLKLFPPFSVSYSILMVATHTSCSSSGSEPCSPIPLLAWEFMGSTVVMTLLPVPLALLAVVWADGRPGCVSCGPRPAPAPQGRIAGQPPSGAATGGAAIPVLAGQSVEAEEEDLDVQGERAIVHMGGPDAEATVVLHHLGKIFRGRKPVMAVRDVSLRLFRGECFGLLGPNGAGKTTTVRVLTGEHQPSVGDARILGRTLLSGPERDSAFQHTGCCPQENALFPFLTVRENLVFFAKLRGVDPAEVGAEVAKIVDTLGLGAHADKLFSKCSGGTQRRSCLAASLMGRPDVLFLDEASTGLDPVARRRMWELIRAVRDSGSLVVLTSHSLEEAEALCDRMAIMINGAVACLGPPGHLKRKYGTGYQLELSVDLGALASGHLPGADSAPAEQPAAGVAAGVAAAEDGGDGAPAETPAQRRVRDFVQEAFGGAATLLEQHGGHSRWSLPDASRDPPSTLFQALEDARHRLAIRDYALSQTTLEQVFVSFARRQRT